VPEPNGLDDVRQLLRRFSHRCRNSLSGLKMGLYLSQQEVEGPMPQCWSDLARFYGEIERLFDHLQVVYKPLSISLVRSALGPLLAERLPAWRASLSLQGRGLEADAAGEDAAGDLDPIYLGLALDEFVAWRAEAGAPGCRSHLSWRVAGGCFEITWQEAPAENEVPSRAHRDRAQGPPRPSPCTHSLALALLARIVAVHGGSLETTVDPPFGIKLCWPQFRDCPT
jgi:hypothetical protein